MEQNNSNRMGTDLRKQLLYEIQTKIVYHYSTYKIKQFIDAFCEKYDVDPLTNTAKSQHISKARKLIKHEKPKDKNLERKKLIKTMDRMINKALAKGDIKIALEANKFKSKLLGLEEVEEKDQTINIVYTKKED